MGRNSIPNAREAVFLAILVAGELYGRELRERFASRTGQTLPLGSLYTTLDRMEEQGFLKSRLGDSAHERGGNRRKFYKLTATGLSALNAAQQQASAFAGVLAHG